ncbi:MAG: sulfurtransferase TusA family protein [Enterobacterales bacterium]|nr:sulfurtransferase TusA family protein [Enterobacterales bacterium]
MQQNHIKVATRDKALLVDARGLACPMPLLKLKQSLKRLEKGQTLLMLATDPVSKRDCVSFIQGTEHQLDLVQQGDEFHFHVIKR